MSANPRQKITQADIADLWKRFTSRASASETRIENGIEYFGVVRDGIAYDETQCARCGSSVEFVRCWDCGGEGFHWGEDMGDPLWYDDNDQIPCSTCDGKGGSQHCISDPEWCQAHPLEGREEVKSTALKAQAWND